MKPKINCELPTGLLKDNYFFNDYDFVLFHLYISNVKYREYYKAMRIVHPERLMILDNSAYEFFVKNEKLDLNKYKEVIEELNPDFYILPDVLMDKEKTLELIAGFVSFRMPESSAEPMAVAQGKTEKDLLESLEIYKQNDISNICIPFHNSFFKDMQRDPDLENHFADVYKLDLLDELTEDMKYAMGRVMFVHNNRKLLECFDYVHLLGSHCPFEKSYYQDVHVDSMDTGYPVKLALESEILGKEKSKPNIIIDNFIDKEINDLTRSLIQANIKLFREC